jgi:hypothetical protein
MIPRYSLLGCWNALFILQVPSSAVIRNGDGCVIAQSLKRRLRLLVCVNGGSCSDLIQTQVHIVCRGSGGIRLHKSRAFV